jgi:hypothetical protein
LKSKSKVKKQKQLYCAFVAGSALCERAISLNGLDVWWLGNLMEFGAFGRASAADY